MYSVHPGYQSLMCRSHPCSFCLYLAISLGWNLITFSKFSNVTSRVSVIRPQFCMCTCSLYKTLFCSLFLFLGVSFNTYKCKKCVVNKNDNRHTQTKKANQTQHRPDHNHASTITQIVANKKKVSYTTWKDRHKHHRNHHTKDNT